MKKLFKNPYIIAWLVIFAVIIICASLSWLSNTLSLICIFLVGGECIYTAVLLIIRQRNINKVDLTEFLNDDNEKEKKKISFAQKEGRMNMYLIIFSLLAVGVILLYMTIKSLF